jgi:hypothetical protein
MNVFSILAESYPLSFELIDLRIPPRREIKHEAGMSYVLGADVYTVVLELRGVDMDEVAYDFWNFCIGIVKVDVADDFHTRSFGEGFVEAVRVTSTCLDITITRSNL